MAKNSQAAGRRSGGAGRAFAQFVRPRELDAEFGRERDEHVAVAERPRGRGVTGFDGEHVTRQIRFEGAPVLSGSLASAVCIGGARGTVRECGQRQLSARMRSAAFRGTPAPVWASGWCASPFEAKRSSCRSLTYRAPHCSSTTIGVRDTRARHR
jgi:hypothetical protein